MKQPLSPEEQLALVVAWQDNGDRAARDRLVVGTEEYVRRFIGRTFSLWRVHHDDLVQEGLLGVLVAASRFDRTMNTAFNSYAWYWIKRYARQYLHRQTGGVIELGDAARHAHKMGAARDALDAGGTIEDVAASAEISPAMLEAALPHMQGQESLDQLTLANALTDSAPLPDMALERTRAVERIETLPPRTRDMITSRCGGDSLEAIGERYQLTRERVRQIIAGAMKDVRADDDEI